MPKLCYSVDQAGHLLSCWESGILLCAGQRLSTWPASNQNLDYGVVVNSFPGRQQIPWVIVNSGWRNEKCFVWLAGRGFEEDGGCFFLDFVFCVDLCICLPRIKLHASEPWVLLANHWTWVIVVTPVQCFRSDKHNGGGFWATDVSFFSILNSWFMYCLHRVWKFNEFSKVNRKRGSFLPTSLAFLHVYF